MTLVGCKHDIQNEAAVRQGIMNYLSKRSDLSSMDVTVTKVAFRQNEADATVHFQAKNTNAPGSGLDMQYVLERKGNEWVVKGKGLGSHGEGMGMGSPENPHGMGGVPGGMPSGAMPPGHPAIPQTMPPKHDSTTPPPGAKK